jgi:hypothetical protein
MADILVMIMKHRRICCFQHACGASYNKPRLAKLFEPFRERGLLILMHSNGQIQNILSIVTRRCCFISEKTNVFLIWLSFCHPVTRMRWLISIGAVLVIYFEKGASTMEAMMRAIASGLGIVADRQAGAGFGGCMVALVKQEGVAEFSGSVIQGYTAESGIQPQI